MTKTAPKLLTQAEYARSRKARGLSGGSREAVRKAVDQGRISAFGEDKLIDQQLADAQWDRNTRARVAQSTPGATPAPEPGHAAAQDSPDGPEGDHPPPASGGDRSGRLHEDPNYLQSRSKQAAADARRAEIALAELEGSLVRVDDVKAQLAGRLAPVREGLLQLPARVAPVLAAQSDAGRIQTLLEAEIHKVLSPLAGDRSAPETETGTPAA